MLASVIPWIGSSPICRTGSSLQCLEVPPPLMFLSFVESPMGLFWILSYLLYIRYLWGKSCIDITLIFIATQMTLYVPSKPGTTCLVEIK